MGAGIRGLIDGYMQRLRERDPETVALTAYAGSLTINLIIAFGFLLAVAFLMVGR